LKRKREENLELERNLQENSDSLLDVTKKLKRAMIELDTLKCETQPELEDKLNQEKKLRKELESTLKTVKIQC